MNEEERLVQRLAELGPAFDAMGEALAGQVDVAFAHETLDLHAGLSDAGKLDYLAFFDSGGPKRCSDLRAEREDGTPTSSELDDWLGWE